MRRDEYKMFSDGIISKIVLKNRLVRSATYEAAMTEDGKVTEDMLNIYRNLANGGVGLIVTGHMAVMLSGKAAPKQTCIYDDIFIGEIEKIAKEVHNTNNGCKIVAQLSHVGRQVRHEFNVAECVGPSAIPSPILKKEARELSLEEILVITDNFADAIARVKKAGFDGVQLHGAHGYLLSSFISPYTNHRSDQYGGSLQNRLTILKEIISKARNLVGNFPIFIKINCDDCVEGGIDIDTFPEVAKEIESLGFDAIEISGGMWDCLCRKEEDLGFFPLPIPESRTRINSLTKQSYFLKYAEKIKLNVPIILAGGHRDVEELENILNKRTVDFLSLCRPLISEADLPNRWRNGEGSQKTDCVSCNTCLLTFDPGPMHCMLKQNKLKHKIVKNLVPYIWKFILK